MKTSDKPLVVSISTWLHSLRKVKSTQASRVSFKSNWIDISIEPLFISCHTLQWRVDIKNAKNAPDSVTCLAAPTLYRVSTIQEDLRPGTGQHDAEQIISYLSWKRVLVRVLVTTFCLSLAMSFIWSCVRLLFRSQPSCSEPLTKSFEVSKNAAFCQRSKRVLNRLPRWFYLYWSWWWVDLKREVNLLSVRLWPRGDWPQGVLYWLPWHPQFGQNSSLSPRNM